MKIEPSNEMAETTSTAPPSWPAAAHHGCGDHFPTVPVITTHTPYRSRAYDTHTIAVPMKRPRRRVERPTGRTTSGWSKPCSASPRTDPKVRKTATTDAKKSVAKD